MALDEIGARDDVVRLRLRGDDVAIYGNYQVKASVFEQPAGFSMRLGWSDTVHKLRLRYPPATPFELVIGDNVVQTGRTDSADAKVGPGGSFLEIRGRDLLGALYNGYVDAEQSFSEKTYLDLTLRCLEAVGLGEATVIASNEANRKAITGAQIRERAESTAIFNVVTEQAEAPLTSTTKKVIYNTIKAKLGQTWLQFLQAELKKAGLFIWADVSGAFVLSRPNANQTPYARIVRKPGIASNVIDSDLKNDTAQRYTRAIVYGRGGGAKAGRKKVKGIHVDDDMATLLGGEDIKQIVFHDEDVQNVKQAEFVARRQIGELNRAARGLEYIVSGHTTPGLIEPRSVVWAPDTVIEVDDDLLGVRGLFYVADVTYDRKPNTTTTLSLMYPEDLIFGDDPKKALATS